MKDQFDDDAELFSHTNVSGTLLMNTVFDLVTILNYSVPDWDVVPP